MRFSLEEGQGQLGMPHHTLWSLCREFELCIRSKAAVTNYQQNSALLQSGGQRSESKVLAGPCSRWRSMGESFPASSSFWWLPVFLGLQMPSSSLCRPLPMAFSSTYLCLLLHLLKQVLGIGLWTSLFWGVGWRIGTVQPNKKLGVLKGCWQLLKRKSQMYGTRNK